MPIVINPKQYRDISDSVKKKLSNSMALVGDISPICFNLGLDFKPEKDNVLSYMESNNVPYVTGHQRGDILDISPKNITITHRYDSPTEVGTLAVGTVKLGQANFNVRLCMWSQELEELALVASNHLGGKTDLERLNEIGEDILIAAVSDIEELKEIGRTLANSENGDEYDIDKDPFFDKKTDVNKEGQKFTIKLDFNEVEYNEVTEAFKNLHGTREAIVYNFLVGEKESEE